MAVANPNIAPNLGTKRRRRGRKMPPGLQKIKQRLGPDAVNRARAVGLRRQGRAPASDTRARSARGLPVPPRSTVSPVERIASRVSTSGAEAARTTAAARSKAPKPAKPAKPAVPTGQPPAYGARRKTTLPPGLAKRATGSTAAMPKPPKRPKKPKGY